MAKLPIYEQQTLPGSVRASGQEFGAGVAQAQAQLGGVVADIGLQKLSREYTLNRIDDQESLIGWAQESYTAINDTEDISRPETLAKYSAGLKERAAEIVKNHRGNSESRFQLEAQVNNLVAQYTKSAMGDQIKAQSAKVARVVDRDANELAITAATAPHMIGEIFTEMDRRIDGMKNAIPAGQERQYRDGAKTRMVTSALYSLEASNRIDEMDALMNNPSVNKYIDPDSSRRFGIGVAVARGKQLEETRRVERDVQNWTTRLKRDLTPEEVIKIKSLPQKKSEMTPSDKIVEYELVTGKPAPQSVIDEMFDVELSEKGGVFGNSLPGRAWNLVNDMAPAYAMGMLNPTDKRNFDAAIQILQNPYEDKLTGNRVVPNLPPPVREAIEQGSRFYGGGARTTTTQIGPQGQIPPLREGDVVEIEGTRMRVGPGGWLPGSDPSQQPQQSPTAPVGGGATGSRGDVPQGERDIDNMSLSDLAPYLVGVSSGIGRTVAEIPFGVGDAIGDPIYIRAANRAKNLVELVTNASKPETKIADQYRQELKALVNLEPKVFSSKLAYHSKIAEIDRELRRKLAEVEKKIDGRVPTTLEERKAALEMRNDVLAVLPAINHPQTKVKTRKEVEALPPGTTFLMGDNPIPQTRKR
jgi:hypothetical protein